MQTPTLCHHSTTALAYRWGAQQPPIETACSSDWAQNALAWALSRGIIDGRDGKLASGESVTRAEAATILARFHLLTK